MTFDDCTRATQREKPIGSDGTDFFASLIRNFDQSKILPVSEQRILLSQPSGFLSGRESNAEKIFAAGVIALVARKH